MHPSQLLEVVDDTLRVNLHSGQTRAYESQARIVAVISGSQGGKALAIDTPIPTPDRFKLMGDLTVGDVVFDEQGQPCRVVRATPVMIGHECYRVVFDDGAEIVADSDHLWLTQTHKERKNQYRQLEHPRWVLRRQARSGIRTTGEIRSTLFAPNGASNHSIPLAQAIQYGSSPLPIPAYTLGAWLGDGTSSGTGLTCADAEVADAIAAEGVPISEGRVRANQGAALSYYLSGARADRLRNPETGQYISQGLKPLLRQLGVLGNKHIPECYKTAAVGDRLALLQGLMDTDGYCRPNGRAEFTSINERLARDVVELMRSLGLKPRMSVGRATLGGVDKGPKYRVYVTTDRPIFRLERKRVRQVGGYRPDLRNRYIVAVEPVESVPVRCIQVDSPSALYLAGRDYIVTHNTSFGPIWLDREITTRGGGDYIAATASFDLFKLKMLPAIQEYFEHYLGVGRYWLGDKVMELRNPETGQFMAKRSTDPMWARIILRSAQTKGGLESATAKGAWLDEFGQDEVPLDAYEAVRRRLTLWRGRILITTTPYNFGWLKQQVVDRADKTTIEVINFPSTANPQFPEEEDEELRRSLPPWKYAMFHQGLFERPPGMIYGDFVNKMIYEGGHKVGAFPIPRDWPVFVGVDPGANNTAMIWMARDPADKAYYVFHESLEGGRASDEYAKSALKLAEDKNYDVRAWFVGQKSEKQQRTDWRQAGMRNVKPPPVHDVESGIDRVISLLRQYRLFFFETCEGTLDQMGRYSRKVDPNGEVLEEIQGKEKYHYLDGLRYDVVGAERSAGPLLIKNQPAALREWRGG